MRGWLPLTLRRLSAYVLDVMLLGLVLVPFSFAVFWLIGGAVTSGTAVWQRLLLTVSLPAWTYFILTDWLGNGRSLGKRLAGLRTLAGDRSPGGVAAVIRTALKLLPWELVHLAFFGLARQLGEVTPLQAGVAGSAYVLMALYLLVAARNGGRRSVPDLLAGTSVVRTA